MAVKIARSEDEMLMIHTEKEFKIMKILFGHPNIVKGYALYSEPLKGRAYLIMEKIIGNNILEVVQENGPFPGNLQQFLTFSE